MTAWYVAIAAGAFETVLMVGDGLARDSLSPGAAAAGAGLRVIVFAAALLLTARLARGSRAARTALLVLLGILGLGSLVVAPVVWLVAGAPGPVRTDVVWLVFVASRLVHVGAVVAAVVWMFRPEASGWLAARES